MNIGTRVTILSQVDLSPHTIIEARETGSVVRIDADGEVWVRLDKYHHGLIEWMNCIWLNDYTQEIWDAIEFLVLPQAA